VDSNYLDLSMNKSGFIHTLLPSGRLTSDPLVNIQLITDSDGSFILHRAIVSIESSTDDPVILPIGENHKNGTVIVATTRAGHMLRRPAAPASPTARSLSGQRRSATSPSPREHEVHGAPPQPSATIVSTYLSRRSCRRTRVAAFRGGALAPRR
jgi:hypothetical protein